MKKLNENAKLLICTQINDVKLAGGKLQPCWEVENAN
jgi:hypothetical protein